MHIHKERGWHFSLALPQSFLIWAHNMVASFCWQLRLSALLNKSFISDCFLTLEDVNFYTYILMQSNLDLTLTCGSPALRLRSSAAGQSSVDRAYLEMKFNIWRATSFLPPV